MADGRMQWDAKAEEWVIWDPVTRRHYGGESPTAVREAMYEAQRVYFAHLQKSPADRGVYTGVEGVCLF